MRDCLNVSVLEGGWLNEVVNELEWPLSAGRLGLLLFKQTPRQNNEEQKANAILYAQTGGARNVVSTSKQVALLSASKHKATFVSFWLATGKLSGRRPAVQVGAELKDTLKFSRERELICGLPSHRDQVQLQCLDDLKISLYASLLDSSIRLPAVLNFCSVRRRAILTNDGRKSVIRNTILADICDTHRRRRSRLSVIIVRLKES